MEDSSSQQIAMVEGAEADSEGLKERTLDVFKSEDQALIDTESHGMYNHDPRHTDMFHDSVSEMAIHA